MSWLSNVFGWLKARPTVAFVIGIVATLFSVYIAGFIRGWNKKEKQEQVQDTEALIDSCETTIKAEKERADEYNKIDERLNSIDDITDFDEKHRATIEESRRINDRVNDFKNRVRKT